MRQCFDRFNTAGGCYLKLQTGEKVYFARAVLLAIYGDHPAVCKVTLTGSACPSCYTPRDKMADPPATIPNVPAGTLPLRTETGVWRRKRAVEQMGETGIVAANERATKRANRLGIPLDLDSAFMQRPGQPWLFGPNETLDSLYQSVPQVTLHGFDEGIATKLAWAILEVAVHEGAKKSMPKTQARNPPVHKLSEDSYWIPLSLTYIPTFFLTTKNLLPLDFC